ncbi:hypothetical protein BaRGS_00014513, partial [Batillaria attramentaria]
LACCRISTVALSPRFFIGSTMYLLNAQELKMKLVLFLVVLLACCVTHTSAQFGGGGLMQLLQMLMMMPG